MIATTWLLISCGPIQFTGTERSTQNASAAAANAPATSQGATSPNGSSLPQAAANANATSPQPPTEYGGSSRCENTNTVLCDGFEAQAVNTRPDPNTWRVVVSDANNTIEVSDTRAARGTHSLHVHSPVVGAIGATIRTSKVFPAPNNTIYGRLFLYLDAKQAPGAHSTVVRASGMASNGTNLEQFGAMYHNYVSNWGGPGADNGGYSKLAFPVKKWVCLEWAHKGNDAELDVWADGVNIFVMTNNWETSKGLLQGPKIAYNELDIGWEVYAHNSDDPITGSYDMYIDEIAVDYQRVGCEK